MEIFKKFTIMEKQRQKSVNISRRKCNSKQMFPAFLFNIRNYSREVINIQRREAELNIKLLRVNNFDIKQKRHRIFV